MIKPNVTPIVALHVENSKEMAKYWNDKIAANHKIVREAYPDIQHIVHYCVSHIDWVFNLGSRRREQVIDMENERFHRSTIVYYDDDGNFRRAFRKFVTWIIDTIPCWNIDQHSSIIYRCIYNEMDKIVRKHYPDRVLQSYRDTFQERCFEHFLSTKEEKTPPYDVWRRINLCASSSFWEAVTVQAMSEVPKSIIQALAKDLGVAYNMEIIDDQVFFLTSKELRQLNEGE